MSVLGDRLRVEAEVGYGGDSRWREGDTRWQALTYAAQLADEHEAAALAESAQGRGPHAAAAYRRQQQEYERRADQADNVTARTMWLAFSDLARQSAEAER